MKKNDRVSLTTALFWIVSSVVLMTAIGYAGVKHIALQRQRENNDPRTRIVKIIQTGPQKEALSTLYLAELMQLSIDRPITRHSFDPKRAEAQLLSSPVIKNAKVSFDSSGAILVDYAARRPIAWLYDFSNIGVDDLGVPFPMYPFFSPKKLPEICLSEPLQLYWNRPVEGSKMDLALSLLELLGPAPFEIRRVDVGQAFAESYGKRQIVIIIEESFKIFHRGKEIGCLLPRILRLSAKNYHRELGNYLVMRDELSLAFDPAQASFEADGAIAHLPQQVIDLRVPGMGYVR